MVFTGWICRRTLAMTIVVLSGLFPGCSSDHDSGSQSADNTGLTGEDGRYCADAGPFNDGVGLIFNPDASGPADQPCDTAVTFDGPELLPIAPSYGDVTGCCATVALENDILVVGAGRVYYGGTSSELNKRLYVYKSGDDALWHLVDTLHEDKDSAEFVVESGRIIAANRKNNQVFVYERNPDGGWQTSVLSPADAVAENSFGLSIDASGNTLAIGSSVSRADSVEQSQSNGAVYLFERNNSQWTQTAKLMAPASVNDESFGGSIALHKNRLVVVAQSRVEAAAVTLVFDKTEGGSWDQTVALTAVDQRQSSLPATSVALNEALIAVGFSGAGDNEFDYAPGAVFLYYQDDKGEWRERAITASDITSGERRGDITFGRTVEIADDALIVGSAGEPESGSTHNSLYFYTLNNRHIISETIVHYDTTEYSFGDFFAYDNGLLVAPRFGRFRDDYDPAIFLYKVQR